jgi:hypothetical protein
MSSKASLFSCLYFPFSRLLDEAALKYLLLAFDNVSFLDDVDPEWRSYQLHQLSKEDPTFVAYESLRPHYHSLGQENIIQIVDVRKLLVRQSNEVALGTIADLQDEQFIKIASSPQKFGLPARQRETYGLEPAGHYTWQAYSGKIALPLLEDDRYLSDPIWANHILIPGTERHHWTLSYEGGSAAFLNFFLQASEELRLSPVTTSQLHHELLLRKLKRAFASDGSKVDSIDNYERRRFRSISSHGEIIRLFQEMFPATQMDKVSFDGIIKFRESSSDLRRGFLKEIDSAVRAIDSDPTTAEYDVKVAETIGKMQKQFHELNNELRGVRDKVFPSLVKALSYGVAGGSALSAGVTFLGGLSTGGLIAASALPVVGAFFVSALELWNSKRALMRKQPSSVSYLVRTAKLMK